MSVNVINPFIPETGGGTGVQAGSVNEFLYSRLYFNPATALAEIEMFVPFAPMPARPIVGAIKTVKWATELVTEPALLVATAW